MNEWYTIDRSLDRIRRVTAQAQASVIRHSWPIARPNLEGAVITITNELREIEEILKDDDAAASLSTAP